MGYRSDARLLTTERGVAELGAYIEKNARKQDEPVWADETALWEAKETIGRVGPLVLIGWNWAKWYEEFGSQLIESALKELKEPYQFMRLGEEMGDYKEMRSERDIRPICWEHGFNDRETLGLGKLEIDFNEGEMGEIERVARNTNQTTESVIETLKSLYRANLYEDLKDIKKGEI